MLLLSLFAALYGAFWAARRLVRPIQDLVAGTRAVAKGDFDMRLPLTSHDEMGILVHSFNDMTKRLARTREEARRSQQAVEAERANLAVILARLSTGVISLEPDRTIRTANQAACSILGVDVDAVIGKPLVAGRRPAARCSQQFEAACSAHLEAGQSEWREQLVLQARIEPAHPDVRLHDPVGRGPKSRRLRHRVRRHHGAAAGAARCGLGRGGAPPCARDQEPADADPAFGGADPRASCSASMNAAEAQMLDRATHTIVQQVEAMKEMVNAFSEYARAPEMDVSRFDLNQLIAEVAELYRAQGRQGRPKLQLDPALPEIEADRGRLRQIIHNLLANAIEALEGVEHPQIRVETRLLERPGGQVAEIVRRRQRTGVPAGRDRPGVRSVRNHQVRRALAWGLRS